MPVISIICFVTGIVVSIVEIFAGIKNVVFGKYKGTKSEKKIFTKEGLKQYGRYCSVWMTMMGLSILSLNASLLAQSMTLTYISVAVLIISITMMVVMMALFQYSSKFEKYRKKNKK